MLPAQLSSARLLNMMKSTRVRQKFKVVSVFSAASRSTVRGLLPVRVILLAIFCCLYLTPVMSADDVDNDADIYESFLNDEFDGSPFKVADPLDRFAVEDFCLQSLDVCIFSFI